MIKGVIFDFDGLILDTETPLYKAYNNVFLTYNSEIPLERWQMEVGTKSTFSSLDYLEQKIKKKVNKIALKEQTMKKYLSNINAENARPGVEAYLQEAKQLNLKIGLASSSSYKWVSEHLNRLNILHYFQCIKTADDVEKVKPDPALYKEAAKCLGLEPEECLVFEDSANGAKAAKRANMKCVIVPNEITASMNFCQVEHRLLSMEEMSLGSLLEFIAIRHARMT